MTFVVGAAHIRPSDIWLPAASGAPTKAPSLRRRRLCRKMQSESASLAATNLVGSAGRSQADRWIILLVDRIIASERAAKLPSNLVVLKARARTATRPGWLARENYLPKLSAVGLVSSRLIARAGWLRGKQPPLVSFFNSFSPITRFFSCLLPFKTIATSLVGRRAEVSVEPRGHLFARPHDRPPGRTPNSTVHQSDDDWSARSH